MRVTTIVCDICFQEQRVPETASMARCRLELFVDNQTTTLLHDVCADCRPKLEKAINNLQHYGGGNG